MTEHAEPAQPVVLRLLPGTSAAPGAVPPSVVPPGTGTAPGTVPPSSAVVRMSVSEHAGVALRHWGGGAATVVTELWLKPERLLFVLWHGSPASMAQHLAYVKSGDWVPAELKGTKAGKFIWFLGVAYHVLIAAPLKAVSRTIGAVADKPFRFSLAVILIVLLFTLL